MNDPSVHTVQLRGWLQRMKAGDPHAREEIFRAFCGRLEVLARAMLRRFPRVRRWAQTDDVFQSACMRLLQSLRKVEPASVREFLGLATLEMRRELLDLSRHFFGPHGVGAKHESHAAGPPDERPARDDPEELERWHAFHQGVESLPPEEREVVGLAYYHGWAQVEVADFLQISERTVRRRWEAAMVKLHRLLKDQ